MKQINGTGSSAVLEAQQARTVRNGVTTISNIRVATPASTAVDSARLSTTALRMQRSAGSADVRYQRVASIKIAIDAGTYSVSASAVANKLIESMFG